MSEIDRREFLTVAGVVASTWTVAPMSALSRGAAQRVVALKVDYVDCPLGVDNEHPRFSWQLESDARGACQKAYRVLVSSSEKELRAGNGDVWDSGRIVSGNSIGIVYQGAPLKSRHRYWWAVRVWMGQDDAWLSSESAWWEMGLLGREDWSARWLAVEDERMRADREAGMPWLWAPAPLAAEAGPWIFTLTVQLLEPAAGGELVVTVNDWHWWTQITRVWIDGEAVAGSGDWTNWRDREVYDQPGGLNSTQHQVVRLAPMSNGAHVIAIAVAQGEGDIARKILDANQPTRALAVFARVDLSSGRSVRFGRGTPWKVGVVPDANATHAGFDDQRWPMAVPIDLGKFEPWPERPTRLLRREFQVSKPVVRGRLYATALGAYEARLNGAPVGDALLTPEPAQYDKRAIYQIYDATDQLVGGDNVLGLIVGEGWYGGFDGRFAFAPPPLRVLVQLEIDYTDGTQEIITSGPGWRTAEGPIRSSSLKVGESYDARFERAGWDTAGFDDTGWTETLIAEAPPIALTAQFGPPVRRIETLRPREITEMQPQVHVVDFGRVFAGWCRLHVTGSAGQAIELKFTDALKDNGLPDPTRVGTDPTFAPRVDRFVLKGEARGETFEPRFSYRAFRYVEVTGLSAPLTLDSIEGVVIHTDLNRAGWLRCGHPLVQQIDVLLANTQRANYVAIPTDNNIRELRGWMSDASCFWETAAFNRDMAAFTRRVMDNSADGQSEAGLFPKNAPEPRHSNAYYNTSMIPPGHAAGSIVLPWRAWRQYGDTGIIDRFWTPMRRFLDFVQRDNPDYLWKNNHVDHPGDWLEGSGIAPDRRAPGIPVEVFATAYWAYCVEKVAEMAEATARDEAAIDLRSQHRRIVDAFNHAYVGSDGSIGSGSQTGYVLALRFGLLPESMRPLVARRLVAEIERCGNAIATGTLATEFILDVLVDLGYSKLAYDLLLRADFPSWGNMVRQGATGVWETWDGVLGSRSQPAFGCIGGFLYRRIAGIAAGSPGFRSIIISPVMDARVTSGGGRYESIMGSIWTDWTRRPDGEFILDACIPANTAARVHLPAAKTARIREGRRSVVDRSDIRVLERSEEEAVLEIKSGHYRFAVIA